MGRIYREANPPNMDVLERLAALLTARLDKNERDFERHLIGMVLRERKHCSLMESRLARSEKRLRQMAGEYGPNVSEPTMMVRILVEPKVGSGGRTHYRAYVPGVQGIKPMAGSPEAAVMAAAALLEEAMDRVIDQGKSIEFEWQHPRSDAPAVLDGEVDG